MLMLSSSLEDEYVSVSKTNREKITSIPQARKVASRSRSPIHRRGRESRRSRSRSRSRTPPSRGQKRLSKNYHAESDPTDVRYRHSQRRRHDHWQRENEKENDREYRRDSYTHNHKHKPKAWPTNVSPSRVIGIFNLDPHISERMLRTQFEQYGEIESIRKVVRKNYAFIYYHSVNSATNAKSIMNGILLGRWKVRVDYSISDHTIAAGHEQHKTT